MRMPPASRRMSSGVRSVARRLSTALIVVLVASSAWYGSRETRQYEQSAERFRRASADEVFRTGLISLSSSPHADFLSAVRRLVGHSRVLLRVAGEPCRSPRDSLVTPAGYAIAYALLPATVTCDPARARYILWFDELPPDVHGPPLAADDSRHAVAELTRP